MADKFLVIPNPTKQEAVDFVSVVAEVLGKYGKKVYIPEQYAHIVKCDDVTVVSPDAMSQMDMAVVLGGDGTVLRAISSIKHCDIPVFGINFGHVGYLTQCYPDDAKQYLARVAEGEYEIEERITVRCSIQHGDSCTEAVGINEIVIHRGAAARALHMQVLVNGNLIERLSADGVIVSTPTGSTAYNMSAGGPLVIPTANNVVITPVCAYSRTACSIVASGDDVITIKQEPGVNSDVFEPGTLSVDGIGILEIGMDDVVTVSKASYRFRLAKFTDDSFYQILKNKLRS